MISQTVMNRLLDGVEEISDVTVHVDPEDDEAGSPTQNLPLRHQAIDKLSARWSSIPETREIRQTILHYLDGKIDIDLYLPLSLYEGESELAALYSKLREPLSAEKDFRDLKIFFG